MTKKNLKALQNFSPWSINVLHVKCVIFPISSLHAFFATVGRICISSRLYFWPGSFVKIKAWGWTISPRRPHILCLVGTFAIIYQPDMKYHKTWDGKYFRECGMITLIIGQLVQLNKPEPLGWKCFPCIPLCLCSQSTTFWLPHPPWARLLLSSYEHHIVLINRH